MLVVRYAQQQHRFKMDQEILPFWFILVHFENPTFIVICRTDAAGYGSERLYRHAPMHRSCAALAERATGN